MEKKGDILMYYKNYGNTGMRVSAVGLGTMRYDDTAVSAGRLEELLYMPMKRESITLIRRRFTVRTRAKLLPVWRFLSCRAIRFMYRPKQILTRSGQWGRLAAIPSAVGWRKPLPA